MTIADLKELAQKVADWLDRSGADYTHKIVEEAGGVVLNTIDNEGDDADEDDPYVMWGSWADSGILFKDMKLCTGNGESIVDVNGVLMGGDNAKAIAAMFLGSDML